MPRRVHHALCADDLAPWVCEEHIPPQLTECRKPSQHWTYGLTHGRSVNGRETTHTIFSLSTWSPELEPGVAPNHLGSPVTSVWQGRLGREEPDSGKTRHSCKNLLAPAHESVLAGSTHDERDLSLIMAPQPGQLQHNPVLTKSSGYRIKTKESLQVQWGLHQNKNWKRLLAYNLHMIWDNRAQNQAEKFRLEIHTAHKRMKGLGTCRLL